MAGYTRQSAAQIVNGEIVSAPPLNAEFNQVLAAFNVSTGHRHDGTSNEGPLIALIADPSRHNEVLINTSLNQIDFKIAVSSVSVTQFSLIDGAIVPTTDDDINLGSSAAEFKDLFLDGSANIDALVADTADINGGTIDNATVGATTPAAGAFTTVTATNITVVGSASTIGAVAFTSTGATVTGNLTVSDSVTANNITIVGSASTIGALAITSTTATLTGDFTVSGNITASTIGATNITVTGSASSIGALAITSTTATLTGNLTVSGTVTATTLAADNITVTGSASSIGSVSITSTGATVTGDLTVSGNITASTIGATNITVTGSASTIGAASFTSTAVTITKLISGNVAITGGTISGINNIFDPGSALSYTFNGSTSDADPGNGQIGLNNASSTATTTIFIDNVDSLSSADQTGFISLLSGGNNPSAVLGTVTLRKATFPEIFAQYSVTALTNASGYQKLTVTNRGASSAAPFTSGDSLLVDIALTGDKGDPGTGNLSGPGGGATDNAVPRFNGSTGSDIQNSGVIIDDSNNVTGVNALTVTTNITAANITIVGSASTVGAVAFSSTGATVTGNLTVTGSVTASSLSVNGNISADTISVTNLTVTGSASTIGAVAFTSTAATVTGNLTVTGSVTASSLTVNGNISASTITVADITATGSASTIGAVAFTSTSATITGGLTVTGAVTASNITIVGSASTIGAVAFTSTGATITGGLTVTGAVTASNITIVGSASTLGAITVTTSSVGINTAAVTSGTALEVTGNVRITTTGNGLIFPDGSKQESAASGGTGIAIAMALIFG